MISRRIQSHCSLLGFQCFGGQVSYFTLEDNSVWFNMLLISILFFVIRIFLLRKTFESFSHFVQLYQDELTQPPRCRDQLNLYSTMRRMCWLSPLLLNHLTQRSFRTRAMLLALDTEHCHLPARHIYSKKIISVLCCTVNGLSCNC